mgnify:CR=1 FL=1
MRCKAKKNNGERCTRDAEANSKYCWQHQTDVEDIGGQRPKHNKKDIKIKFKNYLNNNENPNVKEFANKHLKSYNPEPDRNNRIFFEDLVSHNNYTT